MRTSSIRALAVTVGALLAMAPAALAAPPAVTVKAEGNIFTGGLQFDPAMVTVRVGDTVQWLNTDRLVPHTATEDHGLWDLDGSYGATPANPPGFGPGETRERVFEAGTAHYYCKVHPQQMHGIVAVPVDLTAGSLVTAATKTKARHHHRRRGHHRRRSVQTALRVRTITARWAAAPAAQGLVFDVQRRLGNGNWQEWQTAVSPTGTFQAKQGETWSVRARLRKLSDPTAATDYSPPATITG